MHADCTTLRPRLADTDWSRFVAEAEPLAQELEAAGHDPRHAGRFAADLVDELLDFAAAWDAQVEALRPAPAPAPKARSAWDRALDKAELLIAQGAHVQPVADGAYLVASNTRQLVHRVYSDGSCTCEAGQAGKPCWHAAAAFLAATTRRAA